MMRPDHFVIPFDAMERPGLEHGPCRRRRIPSPLQLNGIKEGSVWYVSVWYVIAGIDLIEGHIPWLEVSDLVGPGTDRFEVIRGIVRFLPPCTGRRGVWAVSGRRLCTSGELGL
jgi:hypothetical protein